MIPSLQISYISLIVLGFDITVGQLKFAKALKLW